MRNKEEVANRILALLTVIGKVHQGNDQKFTNWIKNNSTLQYLSADEVHFLNKSTPNQKDLVQFSWRAEALTALLWSINTIPEMPDFNDQFEVYSVKELGDIIQDPNAFKREVALRDHREIKSMESELVMQHSRVRGGYILEGLEEIDVNPDIVYQRRYALTWLIGNGDNWDRVPTDT